MSSPGSHGSHLKRTLGLPAVLLFGIAMLIVVARRRNAAPGSGEPATLTSAEEARVAELLRSEGAP